MDDRERGDVDDAGDVDGAGVGGVDGVTETESVDVGVEQGGGEARRKKQVDPWSHRRGEPRMFAFLWLMYLLVVVLGGIAWLGRSSGLGVGAHRPTVRTLLLMALIGISVLWPMVRLSQIAPPWPRWRWVLADVFVVCGPVMLLVWPLSFVSAWPPRVPMVLSAGVVAWSLVIGGLVACGLSGRSVGEGFGSDDVGRRDWLRGWVGAGWMLGVVGVVLAGPMVREGMVWAGVVVPDWLGLCSPLTLVGAVTGRGFEAPPDVLALWTWGTLGWVCGFGVCLWVAAFVRDSSHAAEARRLRLRLRVCVGGAGQGTGAEPAGGVDDRIRSGDDPV